MDENLQRLTRALREETCPASVHEGVARRIAAEKAGGGRLRPLFAFAIAIIVVLGCLAVWRWPGTVSQRGQPQITAQPPLTSEQVVAEAEQALASIGGVLLQAGVYSQQTISEEAVPPLRNSLDSTKHKLSQLIKVTL